MAPTRSNEQTVDAIVHGIGLTLSPIAAAILIWSAQDRSVRAIAGLVVYCIGLLAMVGCSALYHLSNNTQRKALFRRLDHAAIFLLIAGTYTPFALSKIRDGTGIGLLVFVWAVAACGIALKLFKPIAIEKVSVAIYLALGWCGLAVLGRLLSALSEEALVLLAAGGLLYTVGVLFHLPKNLRYQNAIWHGFVLAGAACHYAAVLHESL
jgi:hemolysin III